MASLIAQSIEALEHDIEEVIVLAGLYPDLAAQSLDYLASATDRLTDFVGGLEERHAKH
jgi:hypothetical protein